MLRIEFTPEEIAQLHYERYHHPHPKVQKKMEAVYLKSQQLTHQEICQLCRISKPTLWRYLKQYQERGIEGLKQLDYQGQPSQLNEHAPSLKEYFQQQPPRTVAEAQEVIRLLTGIKRSPTQVRAFLNRLGMSLRKVGYVPGKPDAPDKLEEQEAFRKEKLAPLLQAALEGKRAVYFVDAAHFVQRAFLGFVWCFERIFIASPAGRKRFNVLGALNAVTYELITVTNETYINSESICQLLRQLAALKKAIPLTLILDNARYQKCQLVTDLARELSIELVYLPTYSPHFNLIERLWKFVRNECLYSKYYSDFTAFKQAITHCLDTAHTEKKDKLTSWLSWNFQSFKKVKLLAV